MGAHRPLAQSTLVVLGVAFPQLQQQYAKACRCQEPMCLSTLIPRNLTPCLPFPPERPYIVAFHLFPIAHRRCTIKSSHGDSGVYRNWCGRILSSRVGHGSHGADGPDVPAGFLQPRKREECVSFAIDVSPPGK